MANMDDELLIYLEDVLIDWSLERIENEFQKCKNPRRVFHLVAKYIEEKEERVDRTQIENEVLMLSKLFPNRSKKYIRKKLNKYAIITDRLNIVLQHLVKKNLKPKTKSSVHDGEVVAVSSDDPDEVQFQSEETAPNKKWEIKLPSLIIKKNSFIPNATSVKEIEDQGKEDESKFKMTFDPVASPSISAQINWTSNNVDNDNKFSIKLQVESQGKDKQKNEDLPPCEEVYPSTSTGAVKRKNVFQHLFKAANQYDSSDSSDDQISSYKTPKRKTIIYKEKPFKPKPKELNRKSTWNYNSYRDSRPSYHSDSDSNQEVASFEPDYERDPPVPSTSTDIQGSKYHRYGYNQGAVVDKQEGFLVTKYPGFGYKATEVGVKQEGFVERKLPNSGFNTPDAHINQGSLPNDIPQPVAVPTVIKAEIEGNEIPVQQDLDMPKIDFIFDQFQDDDFPVEQEVLIQDEAVADPNALPLVYSLMEMFPDACPLYLRKICRGKLKSELTINELVNDIFTEGDYPKRVKEIKEEPDLEAEINLEDQFEMLKSILPDASPTYLRLQVEQLAGNQVLLENFISNALQRPNYPTMKDYLRKQKVSAQLRQYTIDFQVEQFLELIPDPINFFNKSDRKPSVERMDESYYYALSFLKSHFCMKPVKVISQTFGTCKYNLIATWNTLKNDTSQLRSRRKSLEMFMEPPENIPLMQEIAFLKNYELIEHTLNDKKLQKTILLQNCRKQGLLKVCNCCYDEEVLPVDVVTCIKGCEFCKYCVERGVEVAFGDGNLDFNCLLNCGQNFSIQTLQNCLKPNFFSKIMVKKQVQEIKAAGIEDLVSCPFCDFATIPPPESKIFKCLNPDCMKESCRNCGEPSHIPFRCDEVEKDDEVKKRIHIEDKMTQALIRQCYKCNMKFIKTDGCNKMTCQCGAMMCYVCRQPVKDYKHFNGQGGDQHHLCPLFSDTNKLHAEEVINGAKAAKEEVGVAGKVLKIDPTADVQEHYQAISRRNPAIQNVEQANIDAINRLVHHEVRQEVRHLHNILNNRRGHLHHRHQRH